MNMTFDQAIYVVLSAAQVDVTDNNINAFKNFSSNSEWCKKVIQKAAGYLGLTSNNSYQEALMVLQENGVSIDPGLPQQ